MRFKANYIIIPLATIATMVAGGLVTYFNMGWYRSINLPTFTPSGGFIGAVWTVLFILTAISALIAMSKAWGRRKTGIGAALVVNALLNVFWSVLFFGLHLLGPAVWEAGLLGISVLVLIVMIWPISKFAAWLLVPYLAWVGFATFLTYSVMRLN
ncbi:MAG: TspO/MBR family protein [Patescibacteria group bacterium]